MKKIFSSLKVVELASVLAGPVVGTFFAELGADVTKIENKKSDGDVTRKWKLATEKSDAISAYYASVNFGKKILMMDLRSELDRQEVYALIRECDVVISNFKESSAKSLGMGFDDLKKINPSIIYGQINGFESNSKRVAYDAVLQAETGYMSMTGEVEGAPVKMPLAMIDILAAHQLKEGILIALLQREKGAKAQYVSTSLERTALSTLANQAGNYLMEGHVPQKMGSMHPNIAPYGEIFKSKDDVSFITAIGSDAQFSKLLSFLQVNPDPRFETNKKRIVNRKALEEVLSDALRTKTMDDVFQFCLENNIPIGEIKTLDKVLETDLAQSMILEENIEGQTTKRMSSVAFKLS